MENIVIQEYVIVIQGYIVIFVQDILTVLNAFVFDQFQNGYYEIGKKVGQAWNSGKKFMDN